jgi:hypothetical protein
MLDKFTQVPRDIGGAPGVVAFLQDLHHRHRRLGEMRDTLPQMNSSRIISPTTRMRRLGSRISATRERFTRFERAGRHDTLNWNPLSGRGLEW